MYNPETRLNAQQALQHPFLAGVELSAVRQESMADPVPRSSISGTEIGSILAAWADEFNTNQAALHNEVLPGLEAALLSAVQRSCRDKTSAEAMADAVRAEVKSAASSASRFRADANDSIQALQRRMVDMLGGEALPSTTAGAGAGAGAPTADAELKAEVSRLQEQLGAAKGQLEDAKAKTGRYELRARQLEERVTQLEAEKTMGTLAIKGGDATMKVPPHRSRPRGSPSLACVLSTGPPAQVDEDSEKTAAEERPARRSGARSYMGGFFSNNGIVPSPLLKRPSTIAAQSGRGKDSGEDSQQVIMDGSHNLGQVRPNGALSPTSNATSPLPRGTSKWGIRGSVNNAGSSDPMQPLGEEMMPSTRRPNRCARPRSAACSRTGASTSPLPSPSTPPPSSLPCPPSPRVVSAQAIRHRR